jgi:hypothetical protein
MAKTFEQFLEYRNKQLGKKHGVSGYHLFNNEIAKAIFDAKPQTVTALSKIQGFPSDGERIKKYGEDIVTWFKTSSIFKK